jgi:selenocysteine-specific elongation factor
MFGSPLRGYFDMAVDQEILKIVGDDPNGVMTAVIARGLGKTVQELGDVFERLRADKELLGFAGLWMSSEGFRAGVVRLTAAIEGRQPIPSDKGVALAGLTWSGKPLDRILAKLEAEGQIARIGKDLCLPTYQMELTQRQRALLDRVLEILQAEAVNTPNPHGIAQQLGIPIQAVEEILRLAVQRKEVVQIADVVFYTPSQLEALKQSIREAANGQPFTATDMRDALGTTRKYIQPLLDYLDAEAFTEKQGPLRNIPLK